MGDKSLLLIMLVHYFLMQGENYVNIETMIDFLSFRV